MKLVVVAALSCLWAVLPLGAGAELYEYRTDEGVVSFTDTEQNVPEKYRKSVRRSTEQSIWDYGRTTVVPEGATTAPTEPFLMQEEEAVAEAEELAEADAAARHEGTGPAAVLVDVGGGLTLKVADGELIYVESSIQDTYVPGTQHFGPTRKIYRGGKIVGRDDAGRLIHAGGELIGYIR